MLRTSVHRFQTTLARSEARHFELILFTTCTRTGVVRLRAAAELLRRCRRIRSNVDTRPTRTLTGKKPNRRIKAKRRRTYTIYNRRKSEFSVRTTAHYSQSRPLIFPNVVFCSSHVAVSAATVYHQTPVDIFFVQRILLYDPNDISYDERAS